MVDPVVQEVTILLCDPVRMLYAVPCPGQFILVESVFVDLYVYFLGKFFWKLFFGSVQGLPSGNDGRTLSDIDDDAMRVLAYKMRESFLGLLFPLERLNEILNKWKTSILCPNREK